MNDQAIVIRSFNPNDIEQVVEMLQSISTFKPDHSKFKELAATFVQNSYCFASVAESQEQVIGFGSIFILDRIRGGRSAIVEDVVVHETARRMGIGRLIVRNLLERAQEENCFKASLVTANHNIPFYESLGFAVDHQEMSVYLKQS
ncbi:MAG: GNAT family N-acetyltransferase [Rhodobacteraceae bacterium]|nr:GNAT family N-acetyltransferase [Paracoccaceae bacterium]